MRPLSPSAATLIAAIMFLPTLSFAQVAIIAPSVSTSMEARQIMRKNGWIESSLRDAQAILVVVRTMLSNPLNYSYDSIKELQDGAETCLNITGENFAIYLYEIGSDLSVSQSKHVSYKAEDD